MEAVELVSTFHGSARFGSFVDTIDDNRGNKRELGMRVSIATKDEARVKLSSLVGELEANLVDHVVSGDDRETIVKVKLTLGIAISVGVDLELDVVPTAGKNSCAVVMLQNRQD